MERELTAIVGFFLMINLLAFLTMLFDKLRSRKRKKKSHETQYEAKRISEGMLFFMATAFGSVGVLAGMFAFRHKTRKWYFLVGIPLLIVQNIAFLYLAYQLLAS